MIVLLSFDKELKQITIQLKGLFFLNIIKNILKLIGLFNSVYELFNIKKI